MNTKVSSLSLNNFSDIHISNRRTPNNSISNFKNILHTSINKLNDSQIESQKMTEDLISGNVDNLHEVMVTAQKAAITLEASVQIQRKVIDAYNEIMRMQV